MHRTWIITGAGSIIAQEFAHLVAKKGCPLILVGRDYDHLSLLAADFTLRYKVSCEVVIADLNKEYKAILSLIQNLSTEANLFIAHAEMINNDQLSTEAISQIIHTNILSTATIIHTYLEKKQSEHQLLFLSSVAAVRGRGKNSLYGGSKAAIEVYLEGLQQNASSNQHITIARLGFIDTPLTYAEPGIFYASPPKNCARACLRGIQKRKRLIYHPFFWRFIMLIIRHLPFFVFKRMRV